MLSTILNSLLSFGEKMMPLCYDVVNMSITASYVFVFLIVCRMLLKKAPKVYSYVLWLVLLFRLLCPVSLPSSVSVLNVLQQNQSHSITRMEYISQENELIDEPTVDLGIPALNEKVNQSLPVPNPGYSATPMQIQAFIYTNLWLLGVYGMILYAIFSMRSIHKMTRLAIRVESGVYECETISSPFAKGFFMKGLLGTRLLQSAIYLPSHLSDDEKQIILAHERMHLRRRDPLVKSLYFVALTLHWFNPLVWVAFYLMNRDMEMSCDEAVLQEKTVCSPYGGSREGYAVKYSDTLLNMAVQVPGRKRLHAVGPLAFGESSVYARIKNALKYRPASFRKKMVLGVVCAAVVLACACNPTKDGIGSFAPLNYYRERLTAYWSYGSDTISMADALWENRTPFIGDNSAVGNLLASLTVPRDLGIVSDGMQLETSQRPYRLVIRYCTDDLEAEKKLSFDSSWVYQNMALLFGAIGNVDMIETRIQLYNGNTYIFVLTREFASAYLFGSVYHDLIFETKEEWYAYCDLVEETRMMHKEWIAHKDDVLSNLQVMFTKVISDERGKGYLITQGNMFSSDSLFAGSTYQIATNQGAFIYDRNWEFHYGRLEPEDHLRVWYYGPLTGSGLNTINIDMPMYIQIISE